MRLAEPIEVAGVFWLPEKPDARLTGFLKISESSEVTVELSGMFGDPLVSPRRIGWKDGVAEPARIVGHLEEGGPITLDGCLWQNVSSSFSSGLSRSVVHADVALIGVAYEKQEEVLFSELRFSVEGLDTWLSISGIEIEEDYTRIGGLIRYHMPYSISLDLQSDVELQFAFGLDLPTDSPFMTEATVKQTVEAVMKFGKPHRLEDFSSLGFRLSNFLTLALDQAVAIQSMTGYLDQEAAHGQERRTYVKVYGRFGPWPEMQPTMQWHNALFRYPDIESQVKEVMVRWFEGYEIFEPAFNLYFASRAQPSQFLDAKILWLTQALEILHRRDSKETEMPEAEFSSLCESLKQSCPEDSRQWFSDRFRYANELSLRRRMSKMLEACEPWFGDYEKRRALVNRICDTRNYLTHYDEDTTKSRATGANELFELHEKLQALFQLHLLKLIGLDDLRIDAIVRGNRYLCRRLGV